MARQDQEHATLEQLSAYLDGALSSSEQAFCDAHLPHCEECRNRLAALRETVNLLRTLPRAEPTRSFVLTPEMLSRSGSPTVTTVATATSAGERPGQLRSARSSQRPGAVRERPALQRQRWGPSLRITLRALSAIAAVLALLLLFSSIYSAYLYQLALPFHSTSVESAPASSTGVVAGPEQRDTAATHTAKGPNVQPSSSQTAGLTPPLQRLTPQPAQGPSAFLMRLVLSSGLLLVSIVGFILTRRPRRQPS